MAGRPTIAVATLVAALVLSSAPGASAHSSARTHGPDPAPLVSPPPSASAAAVTDWCPNTVAGANQYENGQYRYHAIYAHPADRASRLGALGGELDAAAFDASALIEHEYGRAIRFDVGTPCGPGQLDISDVRLPFTEEQLAALAGTSHTATFDAVSEALRQQGFLVAPNDAGVDQLAALTQNYVVWLDGPAPAGSCGQGTALLDSTRSETNLNNLGGKLALIFRNGRDFCGSDVVRHEIGHNLGALQPDAPNTTDGVHCNDAFEDTMCGWESPKVAGGPFNGMYFDYGNDDYWDPPRGAPLGWWTLNLSRFLCQDANCNRPPSARRELASVDDTPDSGDTQRRARNRRDRDRSVGHLRAGAKRNARARARGARRGAGTHKHGRRAARFGRSR
jgi:hypothetical protein